jgi:hypothetical protein
MLQNIHISNDNESLTFFVDISFPLSLLRLLPDWVTRRMYNKELFTLREHLGSHSVFGEVSVANCCSFLCCVGFFLCLHPVSCVPMLSVSLGCPFLITPSVFTNVYLIQNIRSFPHSWFITEFSRRVTQWVPHVEQEFLTFPEHLRSLLVLAEFVTLYM